MVALPGNEVAANIAPAPHAPLTGIAEKRPKRLESPFSTPPSDRDASWRSGYAVELENTHKPLTMVGDDLHLYGRSRCDLAHAQGAHLVHERDRIEIAHTGGGHPRP